MALRNGLLRSSALQTDGLDKPVMLQCRTPQGTNPKGHWGTTCVFIKSLFLFPPCTQSWYTQGGNWNGLRAIGRPWGQVELQTHTLDWSPEHAFKL